MDLRAGVYWFAFTAVGSQPVQVRWVLKSEPIGPESLVDNGVGQSAALSLRLVSPSPSESVERLPPAGPETTARRKSRESAGRSDFGLGAQSDSFEPAGHGEHGAAGTPVLSVRGRRGRRPRGRRRLRRHGRWHSRAASRSPRSSLPSGRPPAVDGHAGRGIPRRLARRGVGRHEPRRPCGGQDRGRGAGSTGTRQGRSNHRARGPAGPLVRRGRSDRRINALGREPGAPGTTDAERLPVLAGEGFDRVGDPRSDRVEHAELGVPTTLVLVSAAAYRLRQLASHWWRVTRRPTPARSHAGRLAPGPHAPRRKPGVSAGSPTAARN